MCIYIYIYNNFLKTAENALACTHARMRYKVLTRLARGAVYDNGWTAFCLFRVSGCHLCRGMLGCPMGPAETAWKELLDQWGLSCDGKRRNKVARVLVANKIKNIHHLAAAWPPEGWINQDRITDEIHLLGELVEKVRLALIHCG